MKRYIPGEKRMRNSVLILYYYVVCFFSIEQRRFHFHNPLSLFEFLLFTVVNTTFTKLLHYVHVRTGLPSLVSPVISSQKQAQVQEPQEQVGEVGNVNSANSPVVVS